MSNIKPLIPKNGLLDTKWITLVKINLICNSTFLLYFLYITIYVLLNRPAYLFLPLVIVMLSSYIELKYIITLKTKEIKRLGNPLKFLIALWSFFF